MSPTHTEQITIDPQVRFGKPCIAGTRMAVEDIAVLSIDMGRSLAEITSNYNLSLASVQAAIAYYYNNKAAIDERRSRRNDRVAQFKRQYPHLIARKLRYYEN